MDKQELHIGQKNVCLARQIDSVIGKETSKFGISGIL